MKWEDDLDNVGPGSLFFHEPPLRYLVNEIIPENIKVAVRSDPKTYHKIVVDWMRAITEKNQFDPEEECFDWTAAKSRSDQVFSEYKRFLNL